MTSAPQARPARVVIYSRQSCRLCDEMREELDEFLRGRLPLAVVDVDTDPELRDRYGLRVPVLEVDGREVCFGRLDPAAIDKLRHYLSGQRLAVE